MEAVGLEIDFPSAAHTMVAPVCLWPWGLERSILKAVALVLFEVSPYLVRVHSSATAEASSR